MKHFRMPALLLALLLCLTACGGGNSSVSASDSDSSAGSSADEGDATAAEVPQEALEDVVKYLTDGAYAADDVVVTVGDTPVTAGQVLYWTAYQQYYMTVYYYNNYGMSFQVTDELENGTTVGESLLQYGMDTAVAYAVGAQRAKESGVALSEENAAALASLHADNVASYGEDRWQAYLSAGLISEEDYTEEQKAEWVQTHGQEFYTHSMMYYACTADNYLDLITNVYYFNTLEDALFGEGGEYEPTGETIDDYLQSYIADNGICWARCILFSTMDCADDAAAAQVQAQAQEAYDQLSALPADQLAGAFTEMQSQYDESGYTAGEVQRYSSSDSLVDGFYDGILALEPGQVGMTGQTAYGYFILLREEDQPDDLLSEAEEDYIISTFDALVQQWKDDYGVSGSTLELDADVFYTRLAELQETLAAADTLS